MSEFTDYMNADEIPWSDNNAEFVDPSFPENSDVNIPKIVSGIGIQSGDDRETSEDIKKMLSILNAGNVEYAQKEEERLNQEARQREEADARLRREAKEKHLQERFEKEQEAKRIREEEEAAEEARLEALAEAKRQANPFRKLSKAFSSIEFQNPLSTKKSANAETHPAESEEPFEEKEPLSEEASVAEDDSAKDTPVKDSPKKEKIKPGTKKTKKNPQKEKEEENTKDWKYIATHDELTGLGNKHAFEEKKGTLGLENFAFLFFNINDLKLANDHFGHTAGNRLIASIAEILHSLFGENAFRVGGDEFVVVYQGKKKNLEKDIPEFLEKFHKQVSEKGKEDPDKIPYAVSTGYALGDGEKSVEDVQDEADKNMYANKEAYKSRHQDRDQRKKKEPRQMEYDALLTKGQRELKETVKDNHSRANPESTERILLEIQRRQNEIEAIFIASPTFDHLFIIQDVNTFVGLVIEMDSLIDYSYLYVVYEGGPQYYGSDEYYSEVTHLFEAISEELSSKRMLTDKDIARIKGINIFKNIYIE